MSCPVKIAKLPHAFTYSHHLFPKANRPTGTKKPLGLEISYAMFAGLECYPVTQKRVHGQCQMALRLSGVVQGRCLVTQVQLLQWSDDTIRMRWCIEKMQLSGHDVNRDDEADLKTLVGRY